MGHDPTVAVVDAFGRTHDHENLFIVGTGVMPTVATCNSTLTAVALALRTADHIEDLRARRRARPKRPDPWRRVVGRLGPTVVEALQAAIRFEAEEACAEWLWRMRAQGEL